jgi:hypothetical protein
VNDTQPSWEERSVARVVPPARPRKLAKAPFVELADGRLQGVVSSGSDIERVYVSSITARTHEYSCSTNNNRPCGGAAHGSLCSHLQMLVDEAVVQYGLDQVARYLHVETLEGASSGYAVVVQMTVKHVPAPAAPVFSRFLRHLSYLELPATTAPVAEFAWFPAAPTPTAVR